MVGHSINSNQLMGVVLDYARDVLVQLIFPLICYATLPVLHCKNGVDVQLGVCVSHCYRYFVPSGTVDFSLLIFYQYYVPNGTKLYYSSACF